MDVPEAIRDSWCALTAERPERWMPENPARLQCSATAIVVRSLLGGDVLIAPVTRDGEPAGLHAWNRLPDGSELDLTAEQFRHGETIGSPEMREPARGWIGAALLEARVRRRLAVFA